MSYKKWRLGDICKKIGSGATPTGGKETYMSHGEIALIRSQNVLDYCFSYDGLAFINMTQAAKLNNVTVEKNDILLNITGDSVARVCQVPNEILPARVNQHVAIIRPKENLVDSKYLKYYLLNPSFKSFMLGMSAVGATRNALTKSMIEDFKISTPSLSNQTQIASILSSLDDKIELNRQTSQTLEAIAQSLFKEWFIDFNFPGATDEMQESELEKIPKGWKVAKLRELLDIKNGFAFKGTDFMEIGVPVIKIKNVKAGRIVLDNLSYVSREVADKAARFRINYNDILISMSGNRIDGSPDTWVGKVALFNKEGEYLLNQRVSILKIKDEGEVSKYFLTQLMSSQQFQYYFISIATSSGGQANISPDFIYNTKVVIPEKHIMDLYHKAAKPIYEMISCKQDEIEMLARLRDNLLPKLIKGEIDFK